MSVVISPSLRKEVLQAARKLRPAAVRTLIEMYTTHAKAAAKRSKRVWTSIDDEKIKMMAERQLKLS